MPEWRKELGAVRLVQTTGLLGTADRSAGRQAGHSEGAFVHLPRHARLTEGSETVTFICSHIAAAALSGSASVHRWRGGRLLCSSRMAGGGNGTQKAPARHAGTAAAGRGGTYSSIEKAGMAVPAVCG